MSRSVDLRELAVDRGPPPGPVRGPRRHVLGRYVLPSLLVAGFAAALGWSLRDSLLPRRSVTVMPVHSSRSAVQQAGAPLFKAAGWIEPRPTPIRVAALAGGVVENLLVVEDQAVGKDEPIARLVDADARLAVASAKADLDLRTAELRRAEAAVIAARTNLEHPTQLRSVLAEADAQLAHVETQVAGLPFEIRRAEARLELAERDLQGKTRAGTSVAGLAIATAKSERDSAQALLEELRRREPVLDVERQARRRVRGALAERLELLTDEKRAVAEADAAVRSAAAAIEAARVRRAEAELRLARMTIVAPVAGRILHLLSAPGTRLADGMGTSPGRGDGSTVVTMYEPHRLQVRCDVRFENLPQVGLGQEVRIESPALSKPLRGRVLFLTSSANIQKNTLEVKVALDDPPAVFKPEMLVDATFLEPDRATPAAPSEELRLYVPRPLVGTDERGTFVWTAEIASGRARRTTVGLGRDAGPLVEVVSGLTPASRLIVAGRDGLQDGDLVSVTGEDDGQGIGNAAPAPSAAHAH